MDYVVKAECDAEAKVWVATSDTSRDSSPKPQPGMSSFGVSSP